MDIKKVIPVINAVHEDAKEKGLGRNHGGSSEMTCPLCQGTIKYSVASINGHIWAQCSTKGCVRWIE